MFRHDLNFTNLMDAIIFFFMQVIPYLVNNGEKSFKSFGNGHIDIEMSPTTFVHIKLQVSVDNNIATQTPC